MLRVLINASSVELGRVLVGPANRQAGTRQADLDSYRDCRNFQK